MENICEKYAGMMFDYLDGELTEVEKTDFDEHMAECESCRDELDRRRKTLEYIADSAYTASRDLAAAVTGSIMAVKRRNRIARTGSTIAACVVMAAFMTVYFMMGRSKLMSDGAIVPEASVAADTMQTTAQTGAAGSDSEAYDADIETTPETEAPMKAMLAFAPDEGAAGIEGEDDVIEAPVEESAEADAEAAPSNGLITPKAANFGGADAVELYTGIYAPDYAGKIACVAISNITQPESMELLQEGDNYTSYIADYSDGLYDEIAESVGDGVYSADLGEQTERYILYVVIK